MTKYNVVIGAGPTGLSTAYELSKNTNTKVIIIEKNNYIGGVSSTFKYKDCLLDFGAHKFYTQIDSVRNNVTNILKEDFLTVNKKSSIYLQNKMFDYPFKMSQLLLGLKKSTALDSFTKYVFQQLKNAVSKGEVVSYEDYIVSRFGRGLYNLVFKPQASKIWDDPKKLSKILAEIRVPVSSLLQLIIQILFKKDKVQNKEVNASVYNYPKNGSIEISQRYLEEVLKSGGKHFLNSKPIEIRLDDNRVKSVIISNNGVTETIDVENVISTMPVNELSSLIKPSVSNDVSESSSLLRFKGCMIVYFLLNVPKYSDDQWVFFPESKYTFNRLYEQKLFSKDTVPYSDKTVIGLDFTAFYGDNLWNTDDKALASRIANEMSASNLVNKSLIEDSFIKRIEKVYPIYDIGFEKHLNKILDFESGIENLYTTGRMGLFNYSNMDHSIDMGTRLAKQLNKNAEKKYFWEKEKSYYLTYRIVD